MTTRKTTNWVKYFALCEIMYAFVRWTIHLSIFLKISTHPNSFDQLNIGLIQHSTAVTTASWSTCTFEGITLQLEWQMQLKGPYADHILIPQGSIGSSTFLISNENPYFSSCKSKTSSSNSLQFWRYDQKCEVNWYTRKLFMYFHNSLIPRDVYFLLPLESKQEASSGWNFTKCISEVKVNQLKLKNIYFKWAYLPLMLKALMPITFSPPPPPGLKWK